MIPGFVILLAGLIVVYTGVTNIPFSELVGQFARGTIIQRVK